MSSNRKSTRLRSTPRRPQFETLENRLPFSLWISSRELVATRDGYVVAQDSQSKTLTVLGNDWQWRGGAPVDDSEITPRITDVSNAHNGSVVISDDGRTVTYAPAAGFVGIDQFEYTVVNAKGEVSTAPVYINVVTPYVAVDDWFRVDPDSESSLLPVLDNDRENAALYQEQQRTIVQISSAQHGAVTIMEDGRNVSYRPVAGFEGLDEFTYVIRDAAGHESQAIVQVRVASGNSDSSMWTEKREHELRESALDRYRSQFGLPETDYSYYGDYLYAYMNDVDGAILREAAGNANSTSTTNIQVEGVDEGDIVKTDGDYLYILSNRVDNGQSYQQLIVVDTHDPTEPFVVSRIDFRGRVLEEYLFGDRLFVISTDGLLQDQETDSGYVQDFAVTILDLSDRAQPQLVHETFVEGSFSESRSIGDFVYVVSASESVQNQLPEIEQFCVPETDFCFFETAASYIARTQVEISELASRNASPRFVTYGSDGEELRSGNVANEVLGSDSLTNAGAPVSILSDRIGTAFPYQSQAPRITSIGAFHGRGDTAGPTSGESISLSATEVYASPHAIYLVSNSPSHFANLWSPISTIHKFTLSDEGATVDWVAEGDIEGHIPNQFAMDEHDGYLRVVAGGDWGLTTNRLYVLQQQEEDLEIVGQIDRIAPGERIYSTRFAGDRGFVVTFRKVDPLFAMDLSDPQNPKILGELKIPGYSQYLHFIDETHLIGIGRNANEQSGLFSEMQISLFDVADLSDPKLLHRYSFEGGRDTWSPIMADAWNLAEHHAFSYFPEHQMLALPFYSGMNGGWLWASPGNETQTSIRLFKIDPETGIETIGEVDFEDEFDPRAARTMRIEDSLYAISPDAIKVVDLMNPSQQQTVLYIGRGATDDQAVTRANASVPIKVTTNDDLQGISSTRKILSLGKTRWGGQLSLADDNQTVVYSPPTNFAGTDTFTYLIEAEGGYRSQAMVSVDVRPTWHNAQLSQDINGDGFVTPIDVLIEINFINRLGLGGIEDLEDQILDRSAGGESQFSEQFLDVDNDLFISPMDVMSIINKLNQLTGLNVEGESQSPDLAELADAIFADEDWDPLSDLS